MVWGRDEGWTELESFANMVIPTSRRIYNIGMRVLWQCIRIRTSEALENAVSQVLQPKKAMVDVIRKLEVHVSRAKDVERLAWILSEVRGLEVFIMRDGQHAPVSEAPRNNAFGTLVGPLCDNKTRLKRVQLESEVVIPTIDQCLVIIHSNAHLKTLRVMRTNGPVIQLWTPPVPTTQMSASLTTLSIGASWPPLQVADTVLATLTSSTLNLANLREIEIFQPTSAIVPFLDKYGSQIRRVLYAPPFHSNEDAWWVSLCPNLKQLDWHVVRSDTTPPPESHPKITKVKVDYVKHIFENPWQSLNHLEDTVECFRFGEFPCLEEIEIIMRGRMIPNKEDFEWLGSDEEMADAKDLQMKGYEGWAVSVRP